MSYLSHIFIDHRGVPMRVPCPPVGIEELEAERVRLCRLHGFRVPPSRRAAAKLRLIRATNGYGAEAVVHLRGSALIAALRDESPEWGR